MTKHRLQHVALETVKLWPGICQRSQHPLADLPSRAANVQDEALEAEGAHPQLAHQGSAEHGQAHAEEDGTPFSFRGLTRSGCPRVLHFPAYSVHRQHSVQRPCWTGHGPSCPAACLHAQLGLHCAEYCVAPPPPCLPNIATSVSQQKDSLGQVMGAWTLISVLLSIHVLPVLATQHACSS